MGAYCRACALKSRLFLVTVMRGARESFSGRGARTVSIFADVVTILGKDAVFENADLTLGYCYEEKPTDRVHKKNRLHKVLDNFIALEKRAFQSALRPLVYVLAHEKTRLPWVRQVDERLKSLLSSIRKKRVYLSPESISRLRLLWCLVYYPQLVEPHLTDCCTPFLLTYPRREGPEGVESGEATEGLIAPRVRIERFLYMLGRANDRLNRNYVHPETLEVLGKVCDLLRV